MLKFTTDHEWIRFEGGVATVGITEHAVAQLGDLVFVELPEAGREMRAGEGVAVVESVKAASDVYAPLAGRVLEPNAAIVADPATVNRDPLGDGWFFKMTLADASALEALMDRAAYEAMTK